MLGHGCFFVMTGPVHGIQVFFLLPGVGTWIPRDPSTPRLRRALPLVRRSFSEGGQAGHDEAPNKAPNFMGCIRPVRELETMVSRRAQLRSGLGAGVRRDG